MYCVLPTSELMALSLLAFAHFVVSSDLANVSVRWHKWVNSFKLYLTASGACNATQKRALLLHLAGAEVQDVFSTLDNAGEDKDYELALTKLNTYFTPQKNISYERHMFRQENKHKESQWTAL